MPSVIINNLFKIGELVRLSNGDIDRKHRTEDEPLALNRNVLFERKIIQIKCKYQVVSQFADHNYFLQIQKGTGWDIYWTDKQFLPPRLLRSLMPYQRINYFPGMAVLTNKQNLTQRLNLFRALFPEDYDFFPTTWVVRKNATPSDTESIAEVSTSPMTGIDFTRTLLPSSETEPTTLLSTTTEIESTTEPEKASLLTTATESIKSLSNTEPESKTPLSKTATELTKTLSTTETESSTYLSIKAKKSKLLLTEATETTTEATQLPFTSILLTTTYPDKLSNSLQDYDQDVSDTLETRTSCDTAPRIGSLNSNSNIGRPHSNVNILANTKQNITKMNNQTSHVKPLRDITNLTHVKTAEISKNYNTNIFDKHEFSSEENSGDRTKRVDTDIANAEISSVNERDEPFSKAIQETKNEIIERIEQPDVKKNENVFNINEKLKNLGVRTNIVPLPKLRPTRSASKWLTARSAVNKMQEKQILLKDNVKAMIMALNRVGAEAKGDEYNTDKRKMPSYGKTFNQPMSNKENNNTNNIQHNDTEIDKSFKEVTKDREIVNITDKQLDKHSIANADTETESDDTSNKLNTKNAINKSSPQITNVDQERFHTADIEIELHTSSEVCEENVESITESNITTQETSNKIDTTELDDTNSEFSVETLITTSDEGTKHEVNVGTESDDTSSDISDENNDSEPNVTNEETNNNAEGDTDDASSEFSDENESEQCVTNSETTHKEDIGTDLDDTSSEVSDNKDKEVGRKTIHKEDMETDLDDTSSEISDKKDMESDDSNSEVSNENESEQHSIESDRESIFEVDKETDINDAESEEDNTGTESDDTSDDNKENETEAHVRAASVVENNSIYILKPCDGCQGKGIKLAMNVEQAVESMEFDSMICQEYITNPLLWNGYKFDIRFYVLITSVKQLRIYIYNEGIVRLATEKYERPSESNIDNMFMHLTNYSINKNSENFSEDLSKQSLARMNTFLLEQGVDLTALYVKIHDMIVKTILTGYKPILREYLDTFKSHVYREACFQLLGFDILLDDHHTPYLLEINKNASLKRPTPIDKQIKTQLTRDLFSILNLSEGRLRGDILRDNLSYSTYRKHVEHEMNHRGDFSLIYPCADPAHYEKYIRDEIIA